MILFKDKELYYACILCYIENIMSISHDVEGFSKRLGKYFKLKPDSLKDPYIFLKSKLKKMQMHNGVWVWGLTSEKYVHQSVKNVKNYLFKNLDGRWKLPKQAENTFVFKYAPELNDSPELELSLNSYYQS